VNLQVRVRMAGDYHHRLPAPGWQMGVGHRSVGR
jgi:hypothetical protein